MNTNEWIPVSERLPELNTEVIAVKKYIRHYDREIIIKITVASWFPSGVSGLPIWTDAAHYDFEVTFWMPLPEPPKL